MEARLIIFLLFICTSCAATQNSVSFTDEVEIRGYQLKLSNLDGQCILKYPKKGKQVIQKLNLTGPCYFTRYSSQKIKVFSYEDTNVLSTLIVIGNPISAEKRATWNLSKGEICGEKAQGILIKKTGLHISSKVLEGGVMCPKIGLDEKDFWYLAH